MDITPPSDFMICIGASTPSFLRFRFNEAKYSHKMGPRYALITVVEVRSYSRISGSISLEQVIKTSGPKILRTISAVLCS